MSENTVTSNTPLMSDSCTNAKRLPRAEVRSLRPTTIPASRKRVELRAASAAGRSASNIAKGAN